MPIQKTITLYTYSELPTDRAKERARDWWREASAGDDYFAECITDEMHDALKVLGFDPYRRISNRSNSYNATLQTTLQWSGFWSQGDGAAFGGTWYASSIEPKALRAFLADRPATYERDGATHECASNKELQRIADEVIACKRAGLTSAELSNPGRYNSVTLNSASVDNPETDDTDDAPPELSERFLDAARDLAGWFYKALEAEYDYQNSDEQIAETLEANEYTFTEEGRRHD